MTIDRLNYLRELEKNKPDDAFVKYAIALEYVKRGQDEEAHDVFKMLTEKFNDYVATYYQFAKLLEKMNRKDDAIRIYRDGIRVATNAKDHHAANELKQALLLLTDDDDF